MIDLNLAEDQFEFEVIPNKTLAKVSMRIKKGGHGADGWSTQSKTTGSLYLMAEYTVLEGPYKGRKVFGNIGIFSPNSDKFERMGATFMKAIISSAYGLKKDEPSDLRKISGYGALDGLEFVAEIRVEKDQQDNMRNVIKNVITPEHKDYLKLMTNASTSDTSLENPNAWS